MLKANNALDSNALESTRWDAIVIGTGMGGATLGYALAKAGKRVVFCEKGYSHLHNADALLGDYAEHFFPQPAVPQPLYAEILANAGRSTLIIEEQSSRRLRRHIPFIGEGTGGSSALYGMAMERFFPADFQPRAQFPQATASSLPERWPIGYDELAPYYESAEKLYRVRGSQDPLRDPATTAELLAPPPLSPGNQRLYDLLQRKGLHPYQLPLACEWVAGCRGCQSYLCPYPCKNDSSRVCLAPALAQYGAQLLDRCHALRLEMEGAQVSGVRCTWRGTNLTLKGEQIILAAGALQTPLLLLSSACSAWPQGVANESGLVGRNLMRHCIDLYAVSVGKDEVPTTNVKEIACNDFYSKQGIKLGSVQSFGTLPPAPILVEQLEQDVHDSRWPQAAPLVRLGKPLLKTFFSRVFSRSLILATIMEDLPQQQNRVQPGASPNSMVLHYQLHPHDRERIKLFRQTMRQVLKPMRFLLLKQAENNDRIAHACGTCRFGVDPKESVLNPMNRAHGVANLYVVDSAFFPSSAGINPSLTIAANALRVADCMLDGRSE